MRIEFNPEIHGFQFSNNFIEWSFGPFAGKMLCGGMVYAVLDYFTANISLPLQISIPPKGNPVNNYIYKRQWKAHRNTAHKFVKYWLKKSDSRNEFEKLYRFLKAGQAIPVCFYNKFGIGHHTLGFAVNNANEMSFDVYDPNFPNVISNIKSENGGFRHSVSNYLWKGFFIDDGYKFKKPLILTNSPPLNIEM